LIVLFAVLSYLLGNVPVAQLVEHALGERRLTPWAVHAANALKGIAAVMLLTPTGPWGQMVSATGVVAGHLYPLAGRDDRDLGLGVAAGALAVVSPVAPFVWLFLWAIGFVVSGYQAVGSAVATVFLAPALGWWAGWPLGVISLPVCYMILDRLRPALRRVVLGTEPRHVWRTGG